MSVDKWPCTPNRFSEILDERMVKFILSGASEAEGIPLALIEWINGEPERLRTFHPYQNAHGFCSRLRGSKEKPGIPGGEKLCDEFGQNAAKQLLQDPNVQLMDAIEFECPMGITKIGCLIEAGGHRGVLLTGQQIESAERREKVEDRTKSLFSETISDFKPSDDEHQELIDSLTVADNEKPMAECLQTCAWEVQGALRTYWTKLTRQKESEIYSYLTTTLDNLSRDVDNNMWPKLTSCFEYACDALGCTYACVFADERPVNVAKDAESRVADSLTGAITGDKNPSANILFLKASSGIPSSVLSDPPHFNWRKSELSLNNLSKTDFFKPETVERCRAAIKGVNSSFFRDATIFYPATQVPGLRNVLVLGTFPDEVNLNDHAKFLSDLLKGIGRRILTGQFIRYYTWRESEAEKRSIFLAHQVRSRIQSIYGFQAVIMAFLRNERSKKEVEDANVIFTGIAADLSAMAKLTQRSEGILFDRNSLKIEFVSILPIIEAAIEDQLLYANDKRVEIKTEMGGNLPHLNMDPFWLRLMFDQIFNNAIKYSPHGAYVTVKAESWGDKIIVSVTNIGKGIQSRDYTDIFERWVRLVNGKVRWRRSGMGQGLFEARQIAAAHKGKISVSSRDKRTGWPVDEKTSVAVTTFTIELPITGKEGYR